MKYALLFAVLGLFAGCRSETKEEPVAVEPTASTKVDRQELSQERYAGATGTVAGVVRITGDPAPPLPGLAQIPVGECFKAHERHKHLFRKSADGALVDALVAVTEYDVQLPAPKEPVRVNMEDCSFSQRTVAMMMGQALEVVNRGPSAGTPQLIGSPVPALRVAVPGGDPVRLIPHAPGKYRLVDRSHEFAFAEVFVLNYPTATVTDTAGRFELKGVPIGKARINVLVPLTELTAGQDIEVRANQTTDVQFALNFDLASWKATLVEEARAKGATAPGTAASSAPPPATPKAPAQPAP